jgi:hypothetical protein
LGIFLTELKLPALEVQACNGKQLINGRTRSPKPLKHYSIVRRTIGLGWNAVLEGVTKAVLCDLIFPGPIAIGKPLNAAEINFRRTSRNLIVETINKI